VLHTHTVEVVRSNRTPPTPAGAWYRKGQGALVLEPDSTRLYFVDKI